MAEETPVDSKEDSKEDDKVLSYTELADSVAELKKSMAEMKGRNKDAQHIHDLKPSPSEKSRYFCKDCGNQYADVHNVDAVVKALTTLHEHQDGNFLACPSCKGHFAEDLKEMGYSVREDGRGEIRLVPKPKK